MIKIGKTPLVTFGISSGIAAYKIVDLIEIVRSKDINVEVIMTKTAVAMFGKEMFEDALGKSVYTDLIGKDFDFREVLKNREVEHIKLGDSASLFVVAPATANIIGKLANGIADDFLTTTLLATTAPVLICPSMNVHMYENPIFQENLKKLRKLGYLIMQPDSGQLVCGYEGVGRLAEPQKIAEEIFRILSDREKLKGKKIIVTAGGTSEAIDAVRTINNRASGKMGAAIAEECYKRGADVLLLKSVTAQYTLGMTRSVSRRTPDGGGIKIELFETVKDLEKLIEKHIKSSDAIFHTAAVSDFIPEKKLDMKLESKKPFSLNLKPAPKIINQIKKWNPKIKLIGFKAVYKLSEKELVACGIEKLKESKSDYIIVNDIGKEGVGFGVDANEVYIIGENGLIRKIAKAPKKEVAREILNWIKL